MIRSFLFVLQSLESTGASNCSPSAIMRAFATRSRGLTARRTAPQKRMLKMIFFWCKIALLKSWCSMKKNSSSLDYHKISVGLLLMPFFTNSPGLSRPWSMRSMVLACWRQLAPTNYEIFKKSQNWISIWTFLVLFSSFFWIIIQFNSISSWMKCSSELSSPNRAIFIQQFQPSWEKLKKWGNLR